jgi:hypothetical protein
MSRIMRHFVIGLVTIGQSQVIVLNLEVHKWQDELKHRTWKQCISGTAQVQSTHLHAVDGRTKLHVRCFHVSSTFFLISSQITLQSDNHLASDRALPCFLMTKESNQRLQWDVQSERGGALHDHACTSPNESCAKQSTQDL